MTTPTPLRLTDEVLDVMAEIIDESPLQPAWTAEQFITAIRTLRDRARAVVDARKASLDAMEQAHDLAKARPLDFSSSGAAMNRARTETKKMTVAIDALREVLP